MATDTASLEFVLDLVSRERDKQLAHFDSLDTKAGVVLGFAGVLIAFSPDVAGAESRRFAVSRSGCGCVPPCVLATKLPRARTNPAPTLHRR